MLRLSEQNKTYLNFTTSISNIAKGALKRDTSLCSDVLLRACPKNDKRLLGQLLYYRFITTIFPFVVKLVNFSVYLTNYSLF